MKLLFFLTFSFTIAMPSKLLAADVTFSKDLERTIVKCEENADIDKCLEIARLVCKHGYTTPEGQDLTSTKSSLTIHCKKEQVTGDTEKPPLIEPEKEKREKVQIPAEEGERPEKKSLYRDYENNRDGCPVKAYESFNPIFFTYFMRGGRR